MTSVSTEGVANIPIGDELAVRFAGRYTKHDGYFPNPLTHEANGGIKGEYIARGSLKWQPSALPITLNVVGDYMHYRDTGNATAVSGINPAGPLAAFYGLSQLARSGALPGSTPIPLGPGFSVPLSSFANFSAWSCASVCS